MLRNIWCNATINYKHVFWYISKIWIWFLAEYEYVKCVHHTPSDLLDSIYVLNRISAFWDKTDFTTSLHTGGIDAHACYGYSVRV